MSKIFTLYMRKRFPARKFYTICKTGKKDFLLSKLSEYSLMSIMQLCFIMLIYSGLVLVASFVIAQPVWADDPPVKSPRVDVLPTEGPVGTTVYVRIWDYLSNKQVIVIFGTGITIAPGTTIVAKETTDESGYAVTSFDVDIFAGGRYNILADDGTNKKTTIFRITPKITLGEKGGFVDDAVTVSGNGFAAKKPISVFLDDEKVTTGDADDQGAFSDVGFILPPAAKGDHKIKVQDSEGNNATAVYNVKQQLTVSPSSVSVGSDVTVSGTGFQPKDITIYFDDKDITAVRVDSNGSFTAVIKAPACADGVHGIKVDDGLNRSYCEITVVSTITISPNSGHIGMPVGIQGSGFRPGFPITISFDNTKMDAPTVNTQGTFTFNFKVPKGRSGPHTISVTDGVNTQKTTFTVESTPPLAPTLNLPADSSRVEKGINFGWSAVNDPSGVSYVLEIAKDAKFSEILLSTANLPECDFALPADDKLLPSQKSPYYWRVKAIDGAANVGPWSSIGSFYKGQTLDTIVTNMPDWTKYILIGLGVVLVAFMFSWLGHVLKRAGRVDDSELETDLESNTETTWGYNAEPNEWNQQ